MAHDIRFRYAGTIAGIFVLFAAILLIGGIVLAAYSQGWFEGTFKVRLQYTATGEESDQEGLFGLGEGSEVWVMNTLAGHVGQVFPVSDRTMQAVLVIKKRFRPYIRQDSQGKVKRKFGIAGDAFVQISRGRGAYLAEHGVLPCVNDQELMETAKKMLKDVREVVVPLIDEVQGILKNANRITAKIDSGTGTAGAVVNDDRMANQLRASAEQLSGVMQETHGLMQDTRILVKGMQKHWLVRKYVTQENVRMRVSPLAKESVSTLKEEQFILESALQAARLANDRVAIAEISFNRGVCLLGIGDMDGARRCVAEARLDGDEGKDARLFPDLLQAAIEKKLGKTDDAIAILNAAMEFAGRSRAQDEVRMQLALLRSQLLIDQKKIKQAEADLELAENIAGRLEERFDLCAAAALVRGLWLEAGGRDKDAAASFDKESELWSQAGYFYAMADALARSATVHARMGKESEAAERFLRSARSHMAAGRKKEAGSLLGMAHKTSEHVGDQPVIDTINSLIAELDSIPE